MKKWKWTIILCLILIADSFITMNNGVEYNTMIVWAMDTFNWSLEKAMYLRLLYLIPLVWIIHKWNYVRVVTLSYMGIYISLGLFTYILDSLSMYGSIF